LDACGVLAASTYANITYEKISACYLSIPFNAETAASTLESVIAIFNDYYVFRDSALVPTLEAPFTGSSIDILEKLQTIGRTRYTSDFLFHMDLRYALFSLYDAHSSYRGMHHTIKYIFFAALLTVFVLHLALGI